MRLSLPSLQIWLALRRRCRGRFPYLSGILYSYPDCAGRCTAAISICFIRKGGTRAVVRSQQRYYFSATHPDYGNFETSALPELKKPKQENSSMHCYIRSCSLWWTLLQRWTGSFYASGSSQGCPRIRATGSSLKGETMNFTEMMEYYLIKERKNADSSSLAENEKSRLNSVLMQVCINFQGLLVLLSKHCEADLISERWGRTSILFIRWRILFDYAACAAYRIRE